VSYGDAASCAPRNAGFRGANKPFAVEPQDAVDRREEQSAAPTTSTVPDRVGPCRPLEELGAGGMGRVYLAELEEDRPYGRVGERVALKILHPHLLDRMEEVQRFQRESEIGSDLIHENVVRTYDSGHEDTDLGTIHYLVMEYVEGRTLRQLMRAMKVLPEPLLRDLAQSIAHGLEAIHARGVTHRDIKPSNILITPDYQVKIMDLGVAHTVTEVTRLTQTGHIIGTLQYVAPEQLADNHSGPYSDLYALGVVLYEASTGAQPFKSDNVASSVWRQLEHVPPPPHEVNPQLTAFFDQMIMCLIEKQPDDRFATAAEVATVLREAEGSEWWGQREHESDGQGKSDTFRIQVSRESPFVGRDRELQALLAAYKDVRVGKDRLVYVEGEPGVGKTRLLDAFTDQLRGREEKVQVLYGSYSPSGYGAGTGGVGQAVVDFFGSSLLAERLENHLHGASGLAPAFAARLEGRPPPEGVAPLSSDAVHGLYRKLTRALARTDRTVWIIDDAHFASADSRALITSLARQLGSLGVMVIVTSRPGESGELAGDLLQLPYALSLPLQRLDADAVVAILEGKVTRRSIARRLGTQLATRTAGNPFFVFEIIRELEEQGVLQRLAESPTETSRRIDLFTIPASVRELMQGRLAELSDEERAILDVASIMGFTFDADLIRRILELKRLRVLQALANMERRGGLVRTVGRRFSFDHPQLQELIYEALPDVLREEYHALVAETFEEREGLAGAAPPEMPPASVGFLAEHYFRGNRSESGIPLAVPALEHLRSRHENEALVRLADVITPPLGEEHPGLRADVGLLRSGAFARLGDTEEALEAATDAAAAAELSGDQSRLARARLQVGTQQMVGADLEGARTSLEEALGLADAAGDRRTAIDALADLGRLVFWMGRFAEAEELFVEQLKRAREEGVVEQECEARAILANLYLGLDRLEDARAQAEEHLAVADAAGLRESQTTALFNLSQLAIWNGDYPTADALLNEQLELSQDIAYLPGETLAHLGFSQTCFETGRTAESARHVELGLDLADLSRFALATGYFNIRRGDVAWAEEDLPEASRHYDRALEVLRRIGANQGIAEVLLSQGRIRLARSDDDAARESFGEAAKLVAEHDLSIPGPLPAAYLALMDGAPPPRVGSGRASVYAETHAVLARGDEGGDHAASARALLERMSAHLEGDALVHFWTKYPAARMLGGPTEPGS